MRCSQQTTLLRKNNLAHRSPKMECSFGITGKGYTIIASDSNAARSIVKMKGDEDKMKVLSKNLVMAYNGESGK